MINKLTRFVGPLRELLARLLTYLLASPPLSMRGKANKLIESLVSSSASWFVSERYNARQHYTLGAIGYDFNDLVRLS